MSIQNFGILVTLMATVVFMGLTGPTASFAQSKAPVEKGQGGAILRIVGEKSVYAKVGLKSGDKVFAIDGKAINSAGEVGQLLLFLSGDGKSHRMHIRRDGVEKNLTFR